MTIIYVVLVLYMRNGWMKLPTIHLDSVMPVSKVTVIIAARNEANNISRTLNCLVDQEYPKELLEVIVVDDHSTDRTGEIVASYFDQGVKLITLNEGNKLNSYKKFAINKAIHASSGDIIITTDADCRMGSKWILSIVQYMESQDKLMVSSPVCYDEEKSYFERLQTLEFLYLIGLGAAGIGNGNPTTCNGANLAYRKSLFFEMGGFKGIDELASGDDELLLHKVAEQYADRIGFCKSREAIVYTDAKENLKSFLSQRKRWASKSTKYKDKKVVVLGVCIWLFNLSFFLSILFLFVGIYDASELVITSFMMKFLVELAFLSPIMSFVNRKELLWSLPLLTIVHSLYFVYIGVVGNIGKYDWKGRTVK
ncbi:MULTISPECIES: glycosyltransferase family 2 protein [Sphingobacterium]|uniref:Glycosyl transferase n=1 Tax=Sphingobacterium cellulitidis TaxID=1768011 RepID=A0A8H9KYC1_9SPHI|nr:MULTISPECIES: glycosyltransferase [Sphingobacterium]MBA8987958.1 cellulose synthase/poly-beta-1,6-N-acetylglucosamine synthase-like glycosyltransferase [Sphingobacterium soli]OYD41343.1 glycosyl transferase [Sphingobacterium cellulitidis]OYD45895.1 glycosyl transferase [Sphingobacterium cellulitidis]WFB62912.1 glycosyltransferase [Sphingobacterium sp. WM]GGE26164.1 glycosyl transferase [Sphingobacterium soli]